MAELIAYTLLNGKRGKTFDYYKQVASQQEVEEYRSELQEKHKGKEVRFTTRQKILENGYRKISP